MSIDAPPAWVVLTVAVILSVFCASLIWRQQRRLAAMQRKLDGFKQNISGLEEAHRLLIRLTKSSGSRRSRKIPKSSSPSSDTLEEKMTSSIAPEQPDEKNSKGSALYIVTSKTIPE